MEVSVVHLPAFVRSLAADVTFYSRVMIRTDCSAERASKFQEFAGINDKRDALWYIERTTVLQPLPHLVSRSRRYSETGSGVRLYDFADNDNLCERG